MFQHRFTKESIMEKEQTINRVFGGLQPDVEDVIFVSIDKDPMQEVIVQSAPNNRTFYINISGMPFPFKHSSYSQKSVDL